MAAIDTFRIPVAVEAPAFFERSVGKSVVASEIEGAAALEFFKMRGRDQTCPSGQQPAYVYWTVQDAADPTAAFAMVSDLVCGSDPLTDIVEIEVAMRWREF